MKLVLSGSADSHEGDTTFVFVGADFRFSGEAAGTLGDALGDCPIFTCEPGDVVDLTDHFIPGVSISSFDPATFEGRSWESVALTGDLFLTSTTVTAPAVAPGGLVTLMRPFTFNGTLTGYDNLALEGDPLFSTALRGGGTVSISFTNHPEIGLHASRVTYEFEQTDPVPEPASMMLIGSGLAGLLAARRRARRNTAGPRGLV